MTGLRHALALLTRLPGGVLPPDAAALAPAVAWFPLVGALVGALVAAAYVALLALSAPPLAAAAFAVGISALITGASSEDGLAGSLDAMARGEDRQPGRVAAAASGHGTSAVLGLVVVTLVKASALAALDGPVAAAGLVAAAALGRAAVVGLMGWAPPAGNDVADSGHLGTRSRHEVVLGLCGAAVVGALALGPAVLPAAVAVGATAVAIAAWGIRRVGGVSPDLLGAAEQAGECAVLLLLASVSPATLWFR